MQELRLNPVYYRPEHLDLRETLRRFVAKEIAPHVDAWDEAETFPRDLYRRAADVGLLGLGFADEYGGSGGVDSFHRLIASLELAQAGSGGLVASLMSHTIGAPPVAMLGSAELKQRVLPAVLAGERIAALAITEPSGGSDVSALRCTAVRDGDHYVVTGEKTFITSGIRADYLTVAVRTDPRAEGARGISLLLVEGDTPGLSRTPLRKMGWWASDTAHLRFDGCRVPGRQPARSRGHRLPGHHAELQCRAVLDGCGRGRVCVGLLPGSARRGRASGARSASGSPTTRSYGTDWWTCSPASRPRARCSRRPRGGSITRPPATPSSSPRSAC